MRKPGSPPCTRLLTDAERAVEDSWWTSLGSEEQQTWLAKDRELRMQRERRKDLISAVVICIFAIVAFVPVAVMLVGKVKGGWAAW